MPRNDKNQDGAGSGYDTDELFNSDIEFQDFESLDDLDWGGGADFDSEEESAPKPEEVLSQVHKELKEEEIVWLDDDDIFAEFDTLDEVELEQEILRVTSFRHAPIAEQTELIEKLQRLYHELEMILLPEIEAAKVSDKHLSVSVAEIHPYISDKIIELFACDILRKQGIQTSLVELGESRFQSHQDIAHYGAYKSIFKGHKHADRSPDIIEAMVNVNLKNMNFESRGVWLAAALELLEKGMNMELIPVDTDEYFEKGYGHTSAHILSDVHAYTVARDEKMSAKINDINKSHIGVYGAAHTPGMVGGADRSVAIDDNKYHKVLLVNEDSISYLGTRRDKKSRMDMDFITENAKRVSLSEKYLDDKISDRRDLGFLFRVACDVAKIPEHRKPLNKAHIDAQKVARGAVFFGDLKTLQRLNNEGVKIDFNAMHFNLSKGMVTALRCAFDLNEWEMAEMMLGTGVEFHPAEEDLLIHSAIYNKQYAILETMLNQGIRVKAKHILDLVDAPDCSDALFKKALQCANEGGGLKGSIAIANAIEDCVKYSQINRLKMLFEIGGLPNNMERFSADARMHPDKDEIFELIATYCPKEQLKPKKAARGRGATWAFDEDKEKSKTTLPEEGEQVAVKHNDKPRLD